MKFKDFKYERVNIQLYEEKAHKLLNQIGEDKDLETEIKAIKALQDLDDQVSSMINIAAIRNTIDTNDEFYDQEEMFYNENTPYLQAINHDYTKRLLRSKNRIGLVKEFGELIFTQALISEKTFKPEIIEDLKLENKLITEYNKLTASAQIDFEGQIYNLSQMAPFVQSIKRETRKKASLAVSNFFETNLEAFDNIYDGLVKVRHKIAEKLGYDNFVQLGYDRLDRTDYNSKDVKNYREQILKDVVPYVCELVNRKAKRLNIKDPQSYDLSLSFLSGNPTPKGDRAWQVNQAKEMYSLMSEETNHFFNYMLKHELLDLDAKPSKSPGGYCTFIKKYDAPFIFANFNGTSHDVDVLTHEAGHAFQVYQSRNLISEYRWPTAEAAEIHSMSMEFLAWPWIDKFFKEDTEKYKFNHLSSGVTFLPYGALVDHFQHEVYENPNLLPEERRTLWRKLEKEYLPFKKYDEDSFLENGGFWFRQGHIYDVPFYYIDYTLAQVLAFEYWANSRNNYEKTFENYLNLCQMGGSKSFVSLIEAVGLSNPFTNKTIEKIMKPIKEYLNSVDDAKL